MDSLPLKEKIRNCIRAYVIGDSLGVPYEFQEKGTFTCTSFVGGGTYGKPAGTWSDDTSVLLCWLDAIALDEGDLIDRFKNNLKRWYFSGEFTIDGVFDIGIQTSKAIRSNFNLEETDSMGNGALFHSLPAVLYHLSKKSTEEELARGFTEFCRTTHYNQNCFDFGTRFSLIIRNLLLDLPKKIISISKPNNNSGDIISTYHTVLSKFCDCKDHNTSLREDLCEMINEGNDTDTNAAFLGLLLGTVKPIHLEDWVKIREYEYIDHYIDLLIEKLNHVLR